MLRGRSVCVIGGGVVGLATSRALARMGADVVIVEKEKYVGSGTSGRNSQVIHGGMYYPTGSLKAQCCVEGRRLLYNFCKEKNVPFLVREKLIVATSAEQVQVLEKIQKQSIENGLDEEHGDQLQWISGAEAKRMEPELECVAALRSPSTGVIDGHAFMLALQGDAEQHGCVVALGSQADRVELVEDGKFRVRTGDSSIDFDALVNCAGLYAVQVATQIHQGIHTSQWTVPRAKYAKGNYFKLEGCRNPFSRLIYPVPEAAGLGVHVTVDIGNNARFGPDVEWIDVTNPDEIDYTVDPERCNSFYAEIRKYWPGLPDNSLAPDFAGVRPKIDGKTPQDFSIVSEKQHGVPNLVHLLGIESPGLTSSLSLARKVVDLYVK